MEFETIEEAATAVSTLDRSTVRSASAVLGYKQVLQAGADSARPVCSWTGGKCS